jgi:hypothetical protein
MPGLRAGVRILLIVGVAAAGLAACRLAPDYDDEIVQSLNAATEDTSKFFAKVAGGTTRADFKKREDTYTALIGKYDALAIRLESRAYPQPTIPFVGRRVPVPEQAPSIAPVRKISESLGEMQKIDQASGLKRGDVDGFRRIFVFETRNALTYENALKRDSK